MPDLSTVLGSWMGRTPPLVGVDISSSAVKIVELSALANGRGVQLERYIIEALPREALKEGSIVDLDAVAQTLARAWKRMGCRIKNICMALPAAAVVTRKIVLSGDTHEDELEAQVEAEASQYIPFELDEVNLDFVVLGPAPNSVESVEVLLAASRKENVEDRVAVAQAARLKAIVMDIESYAAEAAFEHVCQQLPDGGANQCIALVDIGATMMNVNIIRNGQLIYTRGQQLGGAQLTQQIEAAFGLTEAEAEAGKIEGGLPERYEQDILVPFRENIAAEINRAMQFFFTSSQQYSEINYIALCGGSAALPGLDDTVAARTQVGTFIANPFAQMAVAARVKTRNLQFDAPSLMTACGLALRRFDPV
jgi:type IV pilus assembly protein PilM